MKYYEVRCNYNNTRVYLYNKGPYGHPEGKVIYDGEIELHKAFHDCKDGFFKPIFKDIGKFPTKSITRKKMKELGFKGKLNKELYWVTTESDHRKDVRIVDEKLFQKLLKGETSLTIVSSCDHLDSNYPESFEHIYLYATEAYHKMGDISRKEGDIAIVSQKDENFYCGNWVEGFGFINVKFPINTSKIISKEEAEGFLESLRVKVQQ